MDIFEILFGKSAKPVRRRIQFRQTVDADGNTVMEMVDGESISLSQDGSIDSASVQQDRFYHCGCNAERPMGGRCGVPGCRRVSCEQCHGRCSLCAKPLCLEHSRFAEAERQENVRLCISCHANLARKRRIGAIVKGVLSPFVEVEKEK